MPQRYDVTLLTETRYENPAQPDWYEAQILHEDQLLRQGLEQRGLRVHRIDWASPDFDWSDTRIAIFRTTWDYFHRITEFRAWMEHAATKTQLINPIALIRWNIDKHYLLDLDARGIRIVPTHIFEQGEKVELGTWFGYFQCEELIIKPCIAGTARHTYRVKKENVQQHQVLLDKLLAEEAMMVQPFQRSISERGETSVIVIGGEAMHAVLKIAKPGDFRVQDDFGGTVHDYNPSLEERQLAEAAVASCQPSPAYARVDMILDNEGRMAISELEMIEPELFFRKNPAAADRLAGIIAEY
jgi:glutathione synthase/RimK-type ligase-like ATP-grasp enzyme